MANEKKPKKHGKEEKRDGKRHIPDLLRIALKAERRRLGATDEWEPERVSLG